VTAIKTQLGKRIDHIAIVVQDLDAALDVYCDALGLPLERVEEIPGEQVKVAFLPLPEGDGEVELVQPTTDDTGIARYLAKRGEGMHHICFEVDDIQAAMDTFSFIPKRHTACSSSSTSILNRNSYR
jgi:methylmalonyl-CoA/ethylmalonyl-CoA epimerase